MSEEKLKGWSCKVYPVGRAEMWVRAFEKDYGRASEGLRVVSGLKREDVIKLAQYSQEGWELYKKLIKELKKVDDLYSDETKVLFCRVYEQDIGNTIRLFSRNVAQTLANMKISYKDEFSFLTIWWSKII